MAILPRGLRIALRPKHCAADFLWRDDLLEARAVSPALNDVENDVPELLNEWRDPLAGRQPEPLRQFGLLLLDSLKS